MVLPKFNIFRKKTGKKDLTGPIEQKNLDLNGMLDDLLVQGQRRQRHFLTMYENAIRYAYGDQHKGRIKKAGWEYPVMNRIFADMQQEVVMLSIGEPRIEATPIEDTDQADAQVLSTALKHQWSGTDGQMMSIKTMQGELDSALSGFRVCKWFWNDKARWDEKKMRWIGRIETQIVNPRYFGCDEDVELAFDLPRKARFIWTKRWVDKRWAAFRWPKYAKYLKDTEDMDYRSGIHISRSRSSTDESQFSQVTQAWSGRELKGGKSNTENILPDLIWGTNTENDQYVGQSHDNLNMVQVQEFWVRDYETEPFPESLEEIPVGDPGTEHILVSNDSGIPLYYDKDKPIRDASGSLNGYELISERPMRNKNKGRERPKYPSGRLIIRLDDGGHKFIATDEPYGVIKTGSFRKVIYEKAPYAIAPNMILPHIWQGVNIVELSRGFQDWLNIFSSHMLMYSQYFADPTLNIQENNVSKKNKGVIENHPGAIRYWKDLGGYKTDQPPSLPQGLFELFELFKREDQDLKGIHDVAHGRASSGDQTLGEIDRLNRNTRLRVAAKGIIQAIWLKQIAYGLVELMQAHLSVGEWIRVVGQDPDKVVSSIKWTEKLADAKVDIKFEAATTLPFDEEREIAKYLEAYKITGPAMLEDVLRKMKIPNVEKILKKHELLQTLERMMEQAEQANIPPEELMGALQDKISDMAAQGGGGQGPSPSPQGPTQGPAPANQQGAEESGANVF